ncbi:MAG: toll/interleukin-1 receptor domain-containing protein [Acidobacteriaceae bacterium]
MKGFVSWSGERSRELAQALHGWLPLVLHYVKPWLSDADVSAGDRWATVVAKELETSNFGIICVTPENLNSPWLLFEAGALAKAMQGSKVIPLLFNLEFSDISGPLAQFQAKKCDREGVYEVVTSINKSSDTSVPDDRANQLFSALWPQIEKQLESIPTEAPTAKHMRPHHEILEELVSGVRGLDGRFREIEGTLSEQGPRSRRRLRHFPMMLEEMIHATPEEGNDPIYLLMLAGILRDDFPWMAEIMTEAYRDTREGDSQSSQRAIKRLKSLLKHFGRRELMFEFAGPSKEAHMLAMEMPMILDRLVHRLETRRIGAPDSNDSDSTTTSETPKS